MAVMGKEIRATLAVRRAYMSAVATGAAPYIAFDVACAAYRAAHPALRDDKLRLAVARTLAMDIIGVSPTPE